ncbi:MAG: hypothetical protein OEZ33_09565, partial [Gammaproteobacteria bacterium]|nr:hypothetical protein [Gammaproteobacteria bacterium]
MAVDTYRIAMGAYGWQYPAWSDDFYPEDLPEEWQLGFYGNEFPVVMFPADYWQQDDAIIAEWIEDSGETLKIICEFGSIEQFLASEERLNILDTRCYAIACKARGSELSVDIISSLSSKPWPVCVELSDDQDLLDSAVLDEMSSRGIG